MASMQIIMQILMQIVHDSYIIRVKTILSCVLTSWLGIWWSEAQSLPSTACQGLLEKLDGFFDELFLKIRSAPRKILDKHIFHSSWLPHF